HQGRSDGRRPAAFLPTTYAGSSDPDMGARLPNPAVGVTMPHITFTIEPDGVIVRVMVGVTGKDTAALVAAGQPVPRPVLLRAAIDTGTDVTMVSSAVLNQFGLTVVSQLSSTTVGGTILANLFEVSLTVPPWGHLTAALLVFDYLEV